MAVKDKTRLSAVASVEFLSHRSEHSVAPDSRRHVIYVIFGESRPHSPVA